MTNVTKGKIIRQDIAWWNGNSLDYTRRDSTGGTIVGSRLGDEIDVYGIYNDYTSTAINSAINQTNGNECTITLAPGTWLITEDLTFPSTTTLKIPRGATLSIASGKTVTINGLVEASIYQIFSGSGTVTMASGAKRVAFPEWWGAKGDGTTSDTTAVQAANDAISGGGLLIFATKTYLFNITHGNRVHILGMGKNVTTFKPAADAPIIKTAVDSSTVQITMKGFKVDGSDNKGSYTSQDGILLKTTTASTFVDDISIEDVDARDCGRYGLRAEGTSTSGPFVQRLHVKNSNFQENTNAGMSLAGTILETVIEGTFCIKNGGSAGTNNNFECLLNTGAVGRVLILGGGFNHFEALNASNTGTAMHFAHASQVKIINAEIESADPFVKITGSLSANISIDTCNFSSNFDATDVILIEDVDQFECVNSDFNAGGTFTNVLSNSTTIGRVKRVDITEFANKNRFTGTITNKVAITEECTIDTGAINIYNNFHTVDTEANAASDDLDSLYDDQGGTATTNLCDGQTVILMAQNDARTIVVKNGTGNLYTKTGADVSLSTNKLSIKFMWRESLSAWVEV